MGATGAGHTGRLEFVDALRGFALLGVFWANLQIFAGIAYMGEQGRLALFSWPIDHLAYLVEQLFIENKFMGLFSLLFGISFWLFLSRARARGGGATPLFYRRILWLFVIGCLHGWLLWAFDVLRFYALWAVLLPLFLAMPPRRLLALALAACVVVPAAVAGLRAWLGPPAAGGPDLDGLALAAFSTGSYREMLAANWRYDWHLTYSAGQIVYQAAVFGRLLLGLYVARTIDFTNLHARRPLLRRVLGVGAVVGIVGNGVFAGKLLESETRAFLLPFAERLLIESGHLALTLAYAAGLGLLFLSARGGPAVRLLSPIGRMALTFYLFQTLFGIWLFYGFAPGPGLMGEVGPAALALLALAGFPVQAWLARAWLRRYRFGPAEWLWRTLTYARMQPFRAVPAPLPASVEPAEVERQAS